MFCLIVSFLVSLSLVLCDPIPLPSPSQQLIIEQPSGHVTTIPLDIPTQLSLGELLTMETPGFRIGDTNEPIEIIPPPIGNWIDTTDMRHQSITTTNTTTTNTTMTNTTTTSSDDGVIANNPWSAMTSINITTETNTTTTTTTITSPTWVDIQNERESRYSHGAPRPAGFARPPNMTTMGTSLNMTIHGNLTSFNLTAHNMTSNHSSIGGGLDSWSFLPGGGQSYITGNLTGSRINMTVIAPNTTISIISMSNGTTTISTNTTVPTTTPTQPSKPTDTNTTTPSSAMVNVELSWLLMASVVLSSVVVC